MVNSMAGPPTSPIPRATPVMLLDSTMLAVTLPPRSTVASALTSGWVVTGPSATVWLMSPPPGAGTMVVAGVGIGASLDVGSATCTPDCDASAAAFDGSAATFDGSVSVAAWDESLATASAEALLEPATPEESFASAFDVQALAPTTMAAAARHTNTRF